MSMVCGLKPATRSVWTESKFPVDALSEFVSMAARQQCGLISVAMKIAFFSICWLRKVDTIPEPVPSSTTSGQLVDSNTGRWDSNRSSSRNESSAGSYILE
ncbi:hypothetical protein OGAPHI_003696 [Ogataea philodendri]|uniref:Uncharacterized protein n=1 Tax=Ogataea philodendri TaxID=1378263 RepID=A0A9P8T4X4_9ASCO|nr:uncharacterized protein OGAPHI_003696 [Ogataea philodendri]KAH3665510.1 hypothetical protein OGAPHI_003696 [Ogataea philodendri]